MQNIEIIEINEEQAHQAKLLASNLSTPQLRKRGLIDMLGISCAVNYLYEKKVKTSTKKSLYKIPALFEEFKISDIYWGNYRIDIITLFKEKTIKIPKIHMDMDILPDFYFVVQIGAKIKEAKIIGFINAKSIPSCSHDSKFYYPTLDMIFDIQRFKNCTKHSIPTKTLLGKHIDCMGLFLKFIDKDLSSVYKRQLIQHLMNCDSCRAKFIDTMEFEKLANNIRHYPGAIRRAELTTLNKNINIVDEEENSFANLEKEIKEEIIKEKEYIAPNDSLKTAEMFDIIDKNDKKQTSKKVIEAIFNEIPKIELPPLKNVMNTKNKRALLTVCALFLTVIIFAIISATTSPSVHNENENIASWEENFNSFEEEYGYTPGEAMLIPKEKNLDDFTIKQPVSTKPTYAPSVSKISLEAPESLVKKEAYTKYLQSIGKNIKLNLQNDLLLVNEIPINKTAKVDIKIAGNGEVNEIQIIRSSGSEMIDNSIQKVVGDTLKYMKPPSHGFMAKPAVVTLSVELN